MILFIFFKKLKNFHYNPPLIYIGGYKNINEIIEKAYFNDLKEYGKGFSYQNLKRMSQFAKEF